MTRQVLENMHMIPSVLNFFLKNLTFIKLIQSTHSSPSPIPSPLSNVLSMPLRELIFAWFPPSAHIVEWDHTYGSEERLLIQGVWSPDQQYQYHLGPGTHPPPMESETTGEGSSQLCSKSPPGDGEDHCLAHRSVVKLMSAQGRNTESSYIRERDSIDSLENIS